MREKTESDLLYNGVARVLKPAITYLTPVGLCSNEAHKSRERLQDFSIAVAAPITSKVPIPLYNVLSYEMTHAARTAYGGLTWGDVVKPIP